MLKRKRVLAAKVETTPGTAEALTGTEGAFNVYDAMIQPTVAFERRERQGSFDSRAGVLGARIGKCTFKHDLAWDGTSTIPSWASVFLPACGYVNSAGTLTPRTEAPGSNVKTLTLAIYQDGRMKKICGAAGNVKITFPAGRVAVAEFEFTGCYVEIEDEAIISPTYPTAKAARFASSVCQLNDVDLAVESVVFDAGNQVVGLEDPSTLSGYRYFMITGREPKLTINPESVLVATQAREAAWFAMTEWAFELDMPGQAGGTVTLDCDKVQHANLQEADRSGVETDAIDLVCNHGASADTSVKLIFTPAA